MRPLQQLDRTRIVGAAVGLIIVSTAACGTSQGATSVMEPTPTPAPTTTTPSVSSDEPASADLIERVRAAAAESYGIDADQVEVHEPQPLAPSGCTVIEVGDLNSTGGNSRDFVLFPDDSLTEVGSDEALAHVSKLCFLDDGILPDPDTALLLALQVGKRPADRALSQGEGTRLLEALGREWTPPSVTATDDGFVISFFALRMTTDVFEVTSTITGDSATTESTLVT